MKIDELLATARDAVTVKRVFNEPLERDGVTVITAAAVAGGGGGGSGHDQGGQEGEGGGFGVAARPAGAYVIKDGVVSWRPAVDVNRLIATVGAITICYLLTRSRARRARAKAAAHRARYKT
ncbi:MAG: sporulation protein [Actinomycetes bacterium]